MDTISVVMTTYNGEKYIEEQLKSILRQTIKPDEVIICDDVSSDNTVLVINNIIESSSINIVLYINQKNLGFIKNFRQAIMKASGNYIFLCDQDDLWEEDKIEKTINLMKEKNVLMACTGIRLIDKNGVIISDTEVFKSDPIQGYEAWTNQCYQISLKRLVWGNFCPGCTYCFTREIADVYEKIENNVVPHDLQLLYIASNMDKAIYIDEPLSRYRLHENNTVGMNNKEPMHKRHFKPRNIRFLEELDKVQFIRNKIYAYFILYFRLPMVRSRIIRKLKLKNILDVRKIQK